MKEEIENNNGEIIIYQSEDGKIKLDVVTKKGLSPYIGEAILNEVEYV